MIEVKFLNKGEEGEYLVEVSGGYKFITTFENRDDIVEIAQKVTNQYIDEIKEKLYLEFDKYKKHIKNI